jgi:hypothetical protein
MSSTNAVNPFSQASSRAGPVDPLKARVFAVPKRRRDGFSLQPQNKPDVKTPFFESAPTDNESEEAINPQAKRSRAGAGAGSLRPCSSAVSSGSEADPLPPRRPRLTRGPKPPTLKGPQANERRKKLNNGPQDGRGGPSLPQFVVPDVSFGSQTASVDPAPVDAMTGSNQGRKLATPTRPQDGAIRTPGNGRSGSVEVITTGMASMHLSSK